ncbi:hypothetical protein [Streptomyces sp. NPDC059009]|uniref:hypothetical protein n=1 Tax=Streptomyces sp. NPDC059009 TaxID=3346694 RepID=UPI0036CC9FD2
MAFTLCGIATVLATRAFLSLAGYPKLGSGGGGGLHIAHMLWGGLLMTAAILLALTCSGRAARRGVAVVGGVGFGLFIDEIGKQVTDEPGYFYQPAAGLIYASFALLLVLTHRLRARSTRGIQGIQGPQGIQGAQGTRGAQGIQSTQDTEHTQRTAHAADLALTGVTSGLTTEQRELALGLLAGSEREVDVALARLLATLPQRPPAPAARWRAVARKAGRCLRRIARTRTVFVLAVFCVLTEALLFAGMMSWDVYDGALANDPQEGANLAVALTEVVSAGLGVAGLIRLRTDRAAAFRLFQAALLADILFGQVFKFTMDQFAAVVELGMDLCLLGVVSAYRAAASRAS